MASAIAKTSLYAFFTILFLPLAFTVLDDSILYNLNWPGEAFDLKASTDQHYDHKDAVIVQTEGDEKYKCFIPSTLKNNDEKENFQDYPSPVNLLSALLQKKTCTYRLEAYWTYEICHGKHIRQYHEEKAAGGVVKVQEYYLGYFSEEPNENGVYEGLGNIPDTSKDIPTKKIDGVMTPYYSLEMNNGTPCPLKGGAKRKTQVLYICHPKARNEIISVTETSSCEYELQILTPALCSNPFYEVKGNPVNEIYCTPIEDSPPKPLALEAELEEESTRTEPSSVTSSDTVEIDVDNTKDDYRRMDDVGLSSETDKALLRDFLSGDYCLKGSSGWWSYEYCYGKHVKQYHDDKTLGRTTIMVGHWDINAHSDWAKKKTPRSYKDVLDPSSGKRLKKVAVVEHYYHNGDFCEEVGKKREVVVKLKCMQGKSKHAVTVYLREPKTCSYILGVESPIICDLLDTADENGLFDDNI